MAALQDFKCPCCDGAISFDSSAQKMKCPYCDSEFEVQTLMEHLEELAGEAPDSASWGDVSGGQWQEGEQDGLLVYTCNSCGGQIVGDETTAATSCPYCDNPVVMTGNLSGELKPDLVIPFKLDKKAAVEALKKHYMGKKLLPKVFKDKNHIEEVKGVYVPFWLFSTEADAHVRYKASRVRAWRDSKYNYTMTSYFSVIREGTVAFERVPVDGSEKMDDALMESIEPFDHSEAVDFQSAYLAGYFADKYDVDAKTSIERANERIKRSTADAFASTVTGYSSVIPEHTGINLNGGSAKYALYPVWMLTTAWNGQRYTFAMNGQTGKFVGDLPLDKGAYRKWLFALWGISAAVFFALMSFLWLI